MSIESVSRFSISLKKDLLLQLEGTVHERGYDNRSLAIADLIFQHE